MKSRAFKQPTTKIMFLVRFVKKKSNTHKSQLCDQRGTSSFFLMQNYMKIMKFHSAKRSTTIFNKNKKKLQKFLQKMPATTYQVEGNTITLHP